MKKLFLFLFLLPLIATAQKPQLVIKTGVQTHAMMASVSPDNKLGLTVEDKEILILWELRTGRQLQSFEHILAADFGLDNKSIDVVTSDYTFRTINYLGNIISESPVKNTARSNKLTYSYYRNAGLFLENGIVYTKDKGYIGAIVPQRYGIEQHYSEKLNLVAIPYAKEVQLCKVPGGEIIKTIKFNLLQKNENLPEVKFTQFSADGKFIMAGNDQSLEIIDIESGQSVYSYQGPYNAAAANLEGSFLDNASFSPDNKRLLILCAMQVVMVDLTTKKEVWKITDHEFGFPAYSSRRGITHFSDDGTKILIGYHNKFQYMNAGDGKLISTLTGTTQDFIATHQLLENVNGLYIEQGGKMINWNLASGALQSAAAIKLPYAPYKIQINKQGSKYYKFPQQVDEHDGNVSNFEEKPKNSSDNTESVSVSFDDKYLLQVWQNKNYVSPDKVRPNTFELVMFDVKTKKTLWRKKETDAAVFSNTSKLLAVANTRGEATAANEMGKYNTVQLLDGLTGNVVKTFSIPKESEEAEGMVFSPKDTYLTLNPYFYNGKLYSYDCQLLIDINTGNVKQISKILPNGKRFSFKTFTDDEKYLVATDASGLTGDVFFYDLLLEKWDLLKTIHTNEKSRISTITISKNDRYIFTNTDEFSVKLWDVAAGKLLATLYPVPLTSDWAVVTPNGHFDASLAAQKDIYFVKGINTFPLAVLYEKFFTPKLLTRLLAGERFAPINTDFDNLNKAPVIKISYEQKTRNLTVEDDGSLVYNNTTGLAEITVNATAENDKIDEIRLFHNGKIVSLATRNLIVADAGSGTDSKKYLINLLPGQNIFTAIALNTQRTESQPDEIVVNYKSATNVVPINNTPINNNTNNSVIASVDKNATLHLLVVGINAYQNKSMSLNYALADATAFKDEVEKDAKTIISKIKTYFVTDNTADKTGITNALKQVQQNAKPQDLFIFYYAGHGVIGKNNEFYLVPTDVSDLENVQTELENKGIAAKLLQQYAIDIPAQKQLFILDACQSAGAFEAMLSADGNKQKSIAVVARSTGTHWIAASGAQQFANEFASLGHGAFTYVLLEALKGAASNNKMITVNNLKKYLQQTVPELMKKYNGSAQYPASYGLGNDFPVEIIK